MARNQIVGNSGNTAEVDADGNLLMKQTGSYVRLSTEPKPTAADGVKDGDDLLLVDTKEVYVYYKGTWYLQ